ncbi:MAG TPA: sn-glycerol-3-phosphate ABC transporter ATP-binding protein UgpC [Verrucomicrobiae bacterium]|nr:sn-glycerol-3-phosphate ABC transporter ATP-binding protein UgpC [Verrucomicrobiae bacterium]
MARLVLENLSKVFTGPKNQQTIAVHNFNLVIEDGEFLVLVGPSGCGKSTTLRMVAGLEDPSTGQISIDQQVVNDVPPKDRDVAMVFQNYALYPHMTVYENLAFGLKLRKFPRPEIDRRVQETAGILGLSELLSQEPKSLSGGQRQRVAVGRAMVRHPKVFLFDEPLSNLDAQLRLQMRLEISRLHARLRSTIIYVTHDQVEAMTMGDRIVVMKQGEVQQVSAPIPLYQQPINLFVAGFIGSPAMNFLHGTIELHQDRLYFAERSSGVPALPPFLLRVPDLFVPRLKPYLDRAIILGLRPEHISQVLTPAAADEKPVAAIVELVEPLGPETIVHCRTAAHSLLARLPADVAVRVQDRITLALEMDAAHFFDPTTELRLG